MVNPRKGTDDQRPDAWARFERAIDAGMKSAPKHREQPKPTRKKAASRSRKSAKRD